MTRHPNDFRSSSPAVQRARAREEARHGGPSTVSRVTRDVASTAGVKVDLDVRVDELDESGVDVHETLPAAWISELLDDGKEPRWKGRGDARVDLHLEREASFVRVLGTTRFQLSHPCVRCLNEVPFDVPMKVDLRLVERAAGPVEADLSEGDGDGDDFEGQPLGDASDLEDLDVASYQDGVVRLGELLREQLFLELPLHPACDSQHARPTQPCAFDARKANEPESAGWTQSRWGALASLRDKLPPGPAPAADKKPDVKKADKAKAEAVSAPKPAVTPAAKPAEEVVPLPGRASSPGLPAVVPAAPAVITPTVTPAAKKPAAKKPAAKKPAAKKPAAKKPAAKKPAPKKAAKKAAKKPPKKAAAKKAAPKKGAAKKSAPKKAAARKPARKPARKKPAAKAAPKEVKKTKKKSSR